LRLPRGDDYVARVKQSKAPRPTRSAKAETELFDRGLIKWMLRLTPLERLRVLEEHVALVAKLQRARPH
jgi:hypothetical protein